MNDKEILKGGGEVTNRERRVIYYFGDQRTESLRREVGIGSSSQFLLEREFMRCDTLYSEVGREH